jgi:hypothetical protein
MRYEANPAAASMASIPCAAWRIDGARLEPAPYPLIAGDFTAM